MTVRVIARAIALTAGWAVVALGALATLATTGVVPPELSFAIPWVPILAGLMSLCWSRMRSAGFARLRLEMAAAGFACLVWLLPDIRIRLAQATSFALGASRPFSLVELNVWDLNPDSERTLAWLRQTNADVIILAEARESFIAEMIRMFPDYPTMVTCAARSYCGTIILSRFSGRPLPGGRRFGEPKASPIGRQAAMALAAAELQAPDGAGGVRVVPVIAVHLDRRGLASVSRRQIDELQAAVGAALGGATEGMAMKTAAGTKANTKALGGGSSRILAGDFNTSPWSPQLRQLDQTIDANRITALAPTWPANIRVAGVWAPPMLAIDQIYLGRGWTARIASVGPRTGSDHLPLQAKFASPPVAQRGAADDKDAGQGR